MMLQEVYWWMSLVLTIGLLQANLENLLLAIKYPAINAFKFKGTALEKPYNSWCSFAFDAPGNWMIYGLKVLLSATLLFQILLFEISWYLPLVYMVLELLVYPRQYFLHNSDAPIKHILLVIISLHYSLQQENISELCLWFISIQISLAYFAAGRHKLKSSLWHNGELMVSVLNRICGKRLHPFIQSNQKVLKYVGWFVIAFEILFFMSLLGGNVTYFLLFFGILFHTFNSVVLGINFFLWTFVACYPAVYYTGGLINNLLF